MSFVPTDATLLFALYGAIFWEPNMATKSEIKDFYEQRRNKLTGSPPSWVFSFVWFILYWLVLLSGFLVFHSQSNTLNYLIEIAAMYLINIVFNKLYQKLFFTKPEGPNTFEAGLAVLCCLVMLGSSGAYMCLVIISNYNWWAFALMMCYSVWVLVATIWTFQWWYIENVFETSPMIVDLEQPIYNRGRNPLKAAASAPKYSAKDYSKIK